MKQTFAIIMSLTLAGIAIAAVMWIASNPVARAVVITFFVSVILASICALVWFLSSWWTRKTMREGAELVVSAQNNNDQWDARKTQSFAQLAKTMYQQSGRAIASQDIPMLPLDQGSWLPAPRAFGVEDGEYSEVETDANGNPQWKY